MAGLGNFRVNFFWQKGAVSGVIRHITDIPKIADLSLPQVLASLIMEKRGLVLVVGATGSGKSTTLASMIDFRNEAAPGHILTMEDPVEYVFTPKKCLVNQREVGNDTHSFHDALRNAMRQAPDIILIGEIRDLETCRMALTPRCRPPGLLRCTPQRLPGDELRHQLFRSAAPDACRIFRCRSRRHLAAPHQDRRRQAHFAVEVLLNAQHPGLIERARSRNQEAMEKSMSRFADFRAGSLPPRAPGKISVDEALGNADSATNLGLLLGNSGIMPAMTERAKTPGATRSSSSPFGGIEISEESEERLQ
jgi:twitching motility protein PilU